MEFSNKGGSVYHRLLAIYVRSLDGDILRSIGKQSESFDEIWPSIRDRVIEASYDDTKETVLSSLQSDCSDNRMETIHIVERSVPSSHHVVGVAINGQNNCSSMSGFEQFFSKLIITQSCIGFQKPQISDEAEALAQTLTNLFDDHLRFEGHDDKWRHGGREVFIDHVRYYVLRKVRLDACLPAFPCKSSNPEKVSGEEPDKGEELALRRLHSFVQEVEKIYEPGARIWIISDGHVFSDCIGVDDSTVDRYGEQLQMMNDTISQELGNDGRVVFKSLVDIFDLRSHVDKLSQVITDLDIAEIDHHVETEHTEDAEVSRRILMAGCAPDPAALRARIDSGEKAILALYRGFSRFMLEDLDQHPATKTLSKKKRKKLASLVSFEMIQRNQSYSNLVEMVFPDHLRLSIHAHNNAGPKFGIQLFDSKFVKATETLEPDAVKASSDDLLHIPTPWHNCVAQVVGNDTIHVVKSKTVEEALDSQAFDGGFVEGDIEDGKGGFFALKDLTGKIVNQSGGGRAPSPAKIATEVVSSGSITSTASETTAASDSGSAQDSSDTDATSIEVDTECDTLLERSTEDVSKNAAPTSVAKETVNNEDARALSVEADDLLNIPYLRLLGVDPATLQELKDTVAQWANSHVKVLPLPAHAPGIDA